MEVRGGPDEDLLDVFLLVFFCDGYVSTTRLQVNQNHLLATEEVV